MQELFILMLAIGVVIFIGYPLMEGRRRTAGRGNHRAGELEARKEAIYAQIKDIDFDYATGKLSDEDYQELRTRYKQDAVSILKEIDRVQHRSAGKRRKKKPAGKQRFCSTCGHPATVDEKFCTNCGTRL